MMCHITFTHNVDYPNHRVNFLILVFQRHINTKNYNFYFLFIFIYMKNEKKIINSFYLQDEFNPDLWDNSDDPKKVSLKPQIRERLLKVANLFINYLDTDLFIQDIIFVGSLVGYNWSEFSDFDIHILIDLDESENRKMTEELFRLKKTVFNAAHDIRIKGYETELFVQDANEENSIVGVYSLLNDEWIRKPDKENFKVDKKKLMTKVNQWMDIIDGVLENAEDEDLEDAIKLVKKYREKLRKYRTCGLQKEGEFSYENLVFKFLRRNGYISKLENFKNEFVDKKLSLQQ